MQPNPSADTSRPLFPRLRFCIALFSLNDPGRPTPCAPARRPPAPVSVSPRRPNNGARVSPAIALLGISPRSTEELGTTGRGGSSSGGGGSRLLVSWTGCPDSSRAFSPSRTSCERRHARDDAVSAAFGCETICHLAECLERPP